MLSHFRLCACVIVQDHSVLIAMAFFYKPFALLNLIFLSLLTAKISEVFLACLSARMWGFLILELIPPHNLFLYIAAFCIYSSRFMPGSVADSCIGCIPVYERFDGITIGFEIAWQVEIISTLLHLGFHYCNESQTNKSRKLR